MEETVILEFKVDQAAAQKSLEQTEKALLDLKKEQQDLTKEYRAGTISQTQYVRENLKLQNAISKEQQQKRTLIKTVETESNSRNALRLEIAKLTKEYDNLDKSTAKGIQRSKDLEKQISSLSSQLTKGNKAAGLFKNEIGNYPKAFGDAASQIRVAGVSVGDVTSKLAAFANPATAAVGIVAALGAAYARSTVGAKDLSFAQNQLSIATTLVTNSIAELITSSEDGEGAVTSLLNSALEFFDKAPTFIIPRTILKQLGVDIGEIQEKSKELALIAEELEDLGRGELEVRGRISERLAENQEYLTEIADEQTGINRKLELSQKIEENLRSNQFELLNVLGQQLVVVTAQYEADQNNEDLLTKKNELARQFDKITADTEKKIQANERAQQKLNQQLREQLALEAAANRRSQTSDDAAILTGSTGIDTVGPLVQPKSSQDAAVEAQKQFANTLLQVNQDYYRADLENKKAAARLKEQIDAQQLANTADFLAQGAALFDENTDAFKVFATASTLISTYSAAQKAYEAAFLPVPTVASPALGAAFAAVAVATGLANVAKINGVEFAEGGYTGPGNKYDVAGVVHKDEYVAPKRVVNSPAAQPHISALERMRTGFADGGFTTNRAIDTTQQALIMTNAFKHLPRPVVSWTEGRAIGNKVEFREKAAKI